MAKKKTEKKEKKLGLFDFLNAIQQDQSTEFFDNLSDGDKKQYKYSKYMIHRFLSMNVHYSPIVNAVQRFTSVPERAHYLFLTNLIPRKKQFNKYIKSKKEAKYESWLIDLLAKHYSVSKKEAVDYLEIFYKQNKSELVRICEMYGIERKQIKKAGL